MKIHCQRVYLEQVCTLPLLADLKDVQHLDFVLEEKIVMYQLAALLAATIWLKWYIPNF